jgi:hypothetical protein
VANAVIFSKRRDGMAAPGDRTWRAILAINALALAYFVVRVPAPDAAAVFAVVVLLDVAAFFWQLAAAVASWRRSLERATVVPSPWFAEADPDRVVEVRLER